MKKKITIKVDSVILQQAESVFAALGMDTEMAMTMFLRQTAMRGELPMMADAGKAAVAEFPPPTSAPVSVPMSVPADVNAGTVQPKQNPEKTVASAASSSGGGSITREMVDTVWRAFKHFFANGGDLSQLSRAVNRQTGMNSGSAFIYLGFLDNLVKGRQQKRNIKYSDVEVYMAYIHDELGPQPYANALASLKQTLPYWRKTQKGKYAYYPDAIQKYLDIHSA